MVSTAIGKVIAVSQKEKTYGVKMGNGLWYNGFGQAPANKGDNVSFEYTETTKNGKTFRNITKFTQARITSRERQPMAQPAPNRERFWAERDEKQARMAALKDITNILAPDLTMSVQEKIEKSEEIAQKWAKWILEGG